MAISKSKKAISLDTYKMEEEEFKQILAPEIPICVPKGLPIRVHPRHVFTGVLLSTIGNQWYLIASELVRSYRFPNLWHAELYHAIDQDGKSYILPLTLTYSDHGESWQESIEAAIRLGRKKWIVIEKNDAGNGVNSTSVLEKIPTPDWPETDFEELLKSAFKYKTIENHAEADRLVMKKKKTVVVVEE